MRNTIFSTIANIGVQIRSLFITGILAILPIALTIVALSMIIRIVNRLITPLRCFLCNTIPIVVPYADVLIIFCSILLLGLIYRLVVVRSLFHALDSLLSAVPLVRILYTGIRQLVHALSAQDGFTFKHVVLVEFPRKGVYSLGFVMSKFPDHLSPQSTIPLYSIYIPTTPNPTTGFFILSPQHEFTIVDLTRQEAMTLIVSGGILQPERFATKEMGSSTNS